MSAEISEAVAAMIASRAEERQQAFTARREADAAFRAEKKRRRDQGLIARHAAKLRRARTA